MEAHPADSRPTCGNPRLYPARPMSGVFGRSKATVSANTLPADRPISRSEAELVVWMLRHASTAGDLSSLEPAVAGLRVVGRCSCGCPSVDFEPAGQAEEAGPIADARGETANGVPVGLILWGRRGAVTGLELYELGSAVRTLPELSSLRPW